jgi:hypothetical protein
MPCGQMPSYNLPRRSRLSDEQHAKIEAGKALADEIQRREAAMKATDCPALIHPLADGPALAILTA